MSSSDKCAGCGMELDGELLDVGGAIYHEKCFICYGCKGPFTDGRFLRIDDQPYCEKCHEKIQRERGEVCARCKGLLTGSILGAMGKKFHANCFVCTQCQSELPNGQFIRVNDQPYCSKCAPGANALPSSSSSSLSSSNNNNNNNNQPKPQSTPQHQPQHQPQSTPQQNPTIVVTSSTSDANRNVASTPTRERGTSNSYNKPKHHHETGMSSLGNSVVSSSAELENSMARAVVGVTQMQKRTYTVWCNLHLAQRGLQIVDLFTDLEDGVMLINLIEIISGYKVKIARYNKNAKLDVHKQENLKQAFDAIKSEGIKLVNIGAADLMSHNERIILGLIWMLILRYQIQDGLDSSDIGGAKAGLLKWVREQIAESYPHIALPDNFHTSFQDGTAMASLIHKFAPEFDHSTVTPPNALQNATNAFNTGLSALKIPKLMEPEDLVMQKPDENSVMTYCSFIQKAAADAMRRKNQNPFHYSVRCSENVTCGVPFQAEIKIAKEATVVAGHDMFVVEIVSPDGVRLPGRTQPQRANQQSSFSVECMALRAGENLLSIKLNGKDIQDSPFKLNAGTNRSCDRATAGTDSCKPVGDGYHKANAMLRSSFTFKLADICGNVVHHGGDKIIAELVGPTGASTSVEVVDLKDGTFQVNYIPLAEGRHTLHLAFQHNNSAVYKQYLQSRETALSTARMLSAATPNIQESPELQKILSLLSSPGLGEYRPIPSDASAPLFMRLFQPFQIQVTGGASGKTSTAVGDGLDHAIAGEPATFTITTRDSSNQLIDKGGLADKIHVDCVVSTGHSPTQVKSALLKPATVQDNNNGTYLVTYIPKISGPNKLLVTIGQENIQNSPFSLKVSPNVTDASQCTAAGPGLTDAAAKIPATFTITARDAFGNARTTGGDGFILKTTPNLSESATIKDNGDGTYTASYTPDETGPLTLNVTLSDKSIKDMPVSLRVMTPVEVVQRNKQLHDILKELRNHRDGIQNAIDTNNAAQCNCGVPSNVNCPSCSKNFNAMEWLVSKFGQLYQKV